MDLKALVQTVNQIAEEKGIESAKVFEAIESALASAYKKEYVKRDYNIRAKLVPETGDVKFTQIREVVDESTVNTSVDEEAALSEGEPRPAAGREEEVREGEVKLPRYNEHRHIFLKEALEIKPDAKLGDELEFPVQEEANFGRIAAQTAKQTILQRLREAERDSIMTEFKDREGDIVSGVIQRFERGNVYVDLGRTNGIMFANESIPGEHYRVGERLRFYVLGVQSESRIPGIILSRAHPTFVAKLFEREIPEITDGVVEIKAIAREVGSRTKVAVISNADGVDPVGSCVGQRGTRIMAITNELGQEKLDVILWSDDPGEFVGNALNPAKVKSVEVTGSREARVLVADDQLSLAIGKGGQNVRLAAKLTGWKIDVRSQARPEEVQAGGVAETEKEAEGISSDSAEGGESGRTIEEGEKPIYHKPEEDE
ncbi:MAG: transcription termination factor NusA [bacterium]|nr:transcription termination factor NusA [bacterium]